MNIAALIQEIIYISKIRNNPHIHCSVGMGKTSLCYTHVNEQCAVIKSYIIEEHGKMFFRNKLIRFFLKTAI